MSLKDRLNLKTAEEIPEKTVDEGIENNVVENILNGTENVLLCCPIDVSTSTAINYVGKKIKGNIRIVAIGDNINFSKSELLKFEPDTKNTAKELIKTALKLNVEKILLQDFYGIEAVDIFKLINAGIKNIITAVYAQDAKSALLQAEINLYQSGINIPNELMKKMLASFIGKILVLKKYGETCFISEIYEIKSVKSNDYILNEIKLTGQKREENFDGFNRENINKNLDEVLSEDEPKISTKRPNNLLAKKLKHN